MIGRREALGVLLTLCLAGWFDGELLAQQREAVAASATKERSRNLYLYVMQAAAMPNVQEELKLTDDQFTVMAEIRKNLQVVGRKGADAREKALSAANKKIESVLSTEQATRLRQIHLQSLLLLAFLMPDVIETLKLTEAQQSKLQTLNTTFMEERRARAATKSRDGRHAAERQHITDAMAGALAVLTPAQRVKFGELLGPKFDFSPAGRSELPQTTTPE